MLFLQVGQFDEGEFLFPCYSVFETISVDFTVGNAFHEIRLRAVEDNLVEDLDLPLAPWS